ncbi:Maf family protein [Umboniibacter marinipuniceus]|uniref:Nucleoside triphosphate pyrophosphatase n=1 Tax=Umboniibacter marinipuniceus TaxID=569599 RepID=A0A3M0APY9_9GAMM|nr:Maf family protein [Umboniibacter marinipuniceus]RMA81082.1 MAF protein [Umboniibacter marinipuniceus]
MTYKLTLASTSSSRKALLAQIGVIFDCQSPAADESVITGEPPAQRAARLATLKANSIPSTEANHWILGSDQVATCNGKLLRKPLTKELALEQLQISRGNWVTFHTAFTLCGNGETLEHMVESRVRFRADTLDSELCRYIELDDPLYCAGSFKTESLGPLIFDQIDASDPTAIQGLPLITLARTLREIGINPLGVSS